TTRQATSIIVQTRSGDSSVAWKSYMQFGSAMPGALYDTRIVFQVPEPFGRNAPITFNFYKDDDATVNVWKSGRTPQPWISRLVPQARLSEGPVAVHLGRRPPPAVRAARGSRERQQACAAGGLQERDAGCRAAGGQGKAEDRLDLSRHQAADDTTGHEMKHVI